VGSRACGCFQEGGCRYPCAAFPRTAAAMSLWCGWSSLAALCVTSCSGVHVRPLFTDVEQGWSALMYLAMNGDVESLNWLATKYTPEELKEPSVGHTLCFHAFGVHCALHCLRGELDSHRAF
jgi:hypothetical protein